VGLTALLGAGAASASTLPLVQGSGQLGPLAAHASSEAGSSTGACVINSLPSFMDQGEFTTSSSVADVVEVECEPVYAEHTVHFSSQELFSRCQHHLVWSTPYPFKPQSGSGYTVTLDNDGNATAVIWAGPSCAAGESLVSAHMEQAPFTTVTTAFTVLPPRPTAPGVSATPKEEVENEETSSVATIVQVEFPPVYAEAYVNVDAEQLYSRCHLPPHLLWIGPGGEKLGEGGTLSGVQLDNDGNAFVVLLGGGSCASGSSLIEASLEAAPYTTYTTSFTIQPPQPTLPVAPEFTIEKLQRLEGQGSFTKSELTGEIGEVVDYEIVVTNTGNTPLEFSNFVDTKCEGIAGGPGGKPVAPGQSTTYTCTHTLTTFGTWTNVATVQGNEGTGTKESNKVVVKVPPHPGFTIEKFQRLGGQGAFTKNELIGQIGQTVEYEIVVTNTGNVTLKFSHFTDTKCEGIAGGASELAPGASTTFTCSHKLTSVGIWTNAATIEGNEGTGSKESNQVVVEVPPPGPLPEPAFSIEKLQRIDDQGSFTKNELTGKIGQVVNYEIIVKNTGNVALKFSNFTDAHCENIAGGPGVSAVPVGGSTTFTCSHTLTSTGTWPNAATIEGNEGTGKKQSNEVIVNVPPEPNFAIEKLQMLSGEIAFTKNELTGTVGQVVYYEIIVTNTGNVPLKLSSFTDVACTGIAGGASELAVGQSTTFTCMHTITGTAPYTNVAYVKGTPPAGQGAPITRESNVVVVKAVEPKKEVGGAKCPVNPGEFTLRNASGPKRHKFVVKLKAAGITQVTFYLDGHKIKTVHASSSKKQKYFTITIDPRRLKYGPHKLSASAEFSDPACGAVKPTSVFVHPRAGTKRVNFTG
jgi:uncharacterized repeat protein (TIGR01451 family)